MSMADEIIIHGRERAGDLLREAARERLMHGLEPKPWRQALAAGIRVLGRQLWPLHRSRSNALRQGIPYRPIGKEASLT